MEWYSGDIGAGIAESKNKQLIFLVYVFDPKAEANSQLWSNQSLINNCKENCISLKLDAESQTCSFFKQIYPVTEYPTTYLIGLDGKPIEIISGLVSEEEFIAKFLKAVEAHNLAKQPEPSQIASTSESQPKISSAQSENENETKSETELKKNIDDRVAQAKEKLKEIQEKKRAEEEEKEKNSEIERRKLGQEILKAKREKEEQELRKIAEEKRKEKLEDEMAKKRILEKIRQDREEKQKKYLEEKNQSENAKEKERLRLEQQKILEKQAEAARNSSIARIQFRFVDGSCISKQFESDQTLSDAKDFVIQKLVEAKENTSFSMHTTFPKKKFTQNDMSNTLRDLNLTPSATILIIPGDKNSSKSNSFSPSSATTSPLTTVATVASDIFTLVYSIFATMWGVVTSFIGFGPSQSENQNNVNNNERQNSPNVQSESIQNLRLRNINNSNNNVRNLNDLRDDDDENATWNGNSTQQM